MRRKRRHNIYNTDYNRISVYPSYKKPQQREHIEIGNVIEVRVSKTDENGDPLGSYKGYTVVILGDAMPGDVVKIRVERVHGSRIWGRLIEG
ncbi:MAG: TRAM domain-containing protein [Desulfurococcales archaeon]|nr:TRAM domain-containing protein [Desulfurococcales archaeon]